LKQEKEQERLKKKEDRENVKKEKEQERENKKREREEKAAKKAAAPKKAMSAYFFFSNASRAKIREEFPQLKITEVSKKIGEMWGKLTEEDKAPYEKQAAEDKERAKAAKAVFDAAQPKVAKRNMTSYMFFSNHIRKELQTEFPDLAITELSKKTGERWKALDDEGKAPFVEQAATDKERFEKEKELYGSPPPKRKKKDETDSKLSDKKLKAMIHKILDDAQAKGENISRKKVRKMLETKMELAADALTSRKEDIANWIQEWMDDGDE